MIKMDNIKNNITIKKIGFLIARLVIILLCCIAAYRYGLKSKDKCEVKNETKEVDNSFWKEKFLFLIKSTYCPYSLTNSYCNYYLYDLDNDKIPELFISTGARDDDVYLEIYTMRNSEAVRLAISPFSYSKLMTANDKLMINYIKDSTQIIKTLSIKENNVEEFQDYYTEDYKNDGEYTGVDLKFSSLTDLNLLNEYQVK